MTNPTPEAVAALVKLLHWEERRGPLDDEVADMIEALQRRADAAEARLQRYGIAPLEEITHRACEILWCKSGQPGIRLATDCHDDGAWNVNICETCFETIGLSIDGQALPEAANVKAALDRLDQQEGDKDG